MRSVRYADKADHMLIWPFLLNQVLTNEKSEKSEKAILTPSSGPQRNLQQLFLVLTQSEKSLLAYPTLRIRYASKDNRFTFKKNYFLFQPSSPLPIETL
jgi:hypothetical protein